MPPTLSPYQTRQLALRGLARGSSLAEVCLRFHVHRSTLHRWQKRLERQGPAGLLDRSRAPRRCPKRLPAYWREDLLALRRKHPRWGAGKLRCLLLEKHPHARRIPSLRSLEQWLGQAALTQAAPARARRGPQLARPPLTPAHRPNDVWTVDFKGWFRTADAQRCEALTVRDLASRYVLAVRIVLHLSDRCVRPLMRKLFERHGTPRIIRVDNGAPFAGCGSLSLTTLSVWWHCCGIRVEFTRPAKPQDNGAHEQMHRILKADTASPPAPTLRAQQRRFQRWQQQYNCLRPHAALGNRRPAQVYRPSSRRWKPPASWSYPSTWITRRVRNRGAIKIHGRLRFIGRAFVHQSIALKPIDADHYEVYLGKLQIGTLYHRDPGAMRPCSYHSLPGRGQPPPPPDP
jgi:putative transposase